MRLGIAYRMHFRYSEPVTESQNEVRVRPLHDEHQQVLSYRLTSRPELQVLPLSDYWGTTVEHLGIRTPHTELELLAEATVETEPRPAPDEAVAAAMLTHPDFQIAHLEFLAPSQHVQWAGGDAVERRAASAVAGESAVQGMVRAVVAEVRGALAYRQGVTDIGVTLTEVLEGGAGVCQDFAHLATGMLRSVGIPARYVSGYLFAADETALDAEDSDVVSVQTHAWIEAALPGWGWWALDPTNGGEVGERHVVIGRGRDYGDVPPVRGAFTGSGTAEVDAEVVIGRQVDGQLSPVDGRGPARSEVAAPPAPNWRHQQSQQQQ
ncbi:MAG: transglutaminase family protein [Acidimicrobiaceae bacterium]|nr:transglutaminase family protein [Acidimicrobiaceae bacterium]